jgi:hypothetical protein
MSTGHTPFLPAVQYTSHYCEENIYLLATALFRERSVADTYDIFIIFVSNRNRRVALWNQKAAKACDRAVIWDYHVILLLCRKATGVEDGCWVYDLDTTLCVPCPAAGI